MCILIPSSPDPSKWEQAVACPLDFFFYLYSCPDLSFAIIYQYHDCIKSINFLGMSNFVSTGGIISRTAINVCALSCTNIYVLEANKYKDVCGLFQFHLHKCAIIAYYRSVSPACSFNVGNILIEHKSMRSIGSHDIIHTSYIP